MPRDLVPAVLRRFARRPGFLVPAIATLAAGIGAATAMFAVVDAVLLRPLPYPEPERAVTVWTHSELPERATANPLSRNEAAEIAARNRVFDAFGAYTWAPVTVLGGGEPRQVTGAMVMHGFFGAMGVPPHLGRTFRPDEDAPGRDEVVVLSHSFWQAGFGGAGAVLGRQVVVDGRPRVVVGVMPPGFEHPASADLWLPMALDRAALDEESIRSHGLNGVGRLRDGVTFEAALADLDRVTRELGAEYPGHFEPKEGIQLFTLERTLLGRTRTPLLALLAAVGFLLLLACANVANLLLLRAEERRRELAVRRALGASPRRLLGQLLGEGLALSLAAALLSVVVTRLSLSGVRALLPPDLPRADGLAVDWRVLGFALLVALATTLLVSLAPAWRMRGGRGTAALRSAAAARGGGRLADALVVGQVALALALCAGAALAARSMQRLTGVDPGFDTSHVLVARVALPEGGRYASEPEVQAFYLALRQRLARDPRVEAVGAASWLPFVDYPSDWPVEIEGVAPVDPPEGEYRNPDYTLISGDYLEALRAPLVSGRLLRPGDEIGLRKAVVTTSFVRRFLGGAEPLGRRVRLAEDPAPYEIVGVVADQRLRGPSAPARAGIFLPHVEIVTGHPYLPRAMALVVRTSGPPEEIAGTVRRHLRDLDPDVPLAELRTFDDIRRTTLGEPRSLLGLLAIFAALGLLLGGIGSFTVAAAWVAHGRRDIGVRMAVGADARRVVGEVLARGARLTALGCLLGGALAWQGARAAGARLLFEVRPSDPLALGAAAATLLLVGLLATAVPARRAAEVDPMRVLREE